MSKRRIVICDDEPQRAQAWADALGRIQAVADAFDTTIASETDLNDGVRALQDRRRQARPRKRAKSAQEVIFDTVDLLLVDYDLLAYDELGVDTGERVAYLARCYSRCGYIVELNQFGDLWFDLTLRGHPDSFADLNLGGGHLHNPGLWQEPFDGFRPWSWPLLPAAVEQYERRVADVLDHSSSPVLEHLGFPSDIRALLPRTIREYVGSNLDATFEEFVTNSPMGMRPNDRPSGDEGAARVAAARVTKFLEHVILPGQDTLVDAPHLARRFPSLLKRRATVPRLNATVSLSSTENLPFSPDKTDRHAFKGPSWLSRPAWFWRSIASDEDIAEVVSPWEASDLGVEFCEDVSRFLVREQTREFVADLSSPFVTRFVARPDSEYAKRHTATARQDPQSLRGVNYRPAARFSV